LHPARGPATHRPHPQPLDASYYLPDMGRDALAEYEAAHIPGARFFDIDEISDARSRCPTWPPRWRNS
jgi:thiosulfate/3-mercaptopyruvate sulfurtransferase